MNKVKSQNGFTLVEVHGGVFENNRIGLAASGPANAELRAYGTVCRDNTFAELYASKQKIIANNVYATNTDTNKLKVTANAGTIQVVNDNILT